MYKYILKREGDRILSFCIDGETGRTVEIFADPAEDETVRIGDIYVGRVEKILPGINAAFVAIGKGSDCYLDLKDATSPWFTKKGSSTALQQSDELLVQIRREAIKSKAAAVTGQISLTGSYSVAVLGGNAGGVSKKIRGEEREKWRNVSARLTDDRISVLIRTLACGEEEEMVEREALCLKEDLSALMKKAMHLSAGNLLYREEEPWLQRILHNYEQTEKIVTDDPELYDRVAAAMRLSGEPAGVHQNIRKHQENTSGRKLLLYEDPLLAMGKLYSLEKRFREATEKKVLLRSGADLIIEPTEAMTVIDVNSSRCLAGIGKKDKEAASLKVNLEAAGEIARQIRLRNLSGIILVDFINLGHEESRQKLMDYLRGQTALDPVKTDVIDMTKLGLVEITRQKKQQPLSQWAERSML